MRATARVSRITARLRSALACALALGLACTPQRSPEAREVPADSAATTLTPDASIRFAIRTAPDAEGPVYIVLNEEDDQVGWVRVVRDGERLYLKERCEIANCGEPPAVCGMAFRMIRNLAAGAGQRAIRFEWNGETSAIDESTGCESRIPAPGGAYVARFCHSGQAEFDEGVDPGRDAVGRLVEPTCVERPFTLADRLVEFVID
jgi:hypothetical protein